MALGDLRRTITAANDLMKVTVAVAALIIVKSVMDGFHDELIITLVTTITPTYYNSNMCNITHFYEIK